jgi:predicted PurR-regulated permease PerM
MAESWIQHALRRTGWRPKRQAASLAVLGMFVAVFIGALYLSQASATSTLGRQLNDQIEERDRIQQENEALRAEIAGYRTVERLLRRAQELGFVQAAANQIQYLVVDGYNPARTATVIELEAEEDPLPAYDESFVGWVQQGVDWLTAQVESFNNQGAR